MEKLKVELGSVFWISISKIPHFYIVIAQIADDVFLLVNLTTRKPNLEATCILTPSRQLPDFIQQESVINYRQAIEMSRSGLQRMILAGTCSAKGKIDPEILLRVQAGGLVSQFLKNRYKDLLKQLL